MKGTVVVAAAGGGGDESGSTSGSDGPAASGTSGDSASTASNLPQTGFELAMVVLLGTLMIAAGVQLRRLAAAFLPRG
jgi:hypothetical protein